MPIDNIFGDYFSNDRASWFNPFTFYLQANKKAKTPPENIFKNYFNDTPSRPSVNFFANYFKVATASVAPLQERNLTVIQDDGIDSEQQGVLDQVLDDAGVGRERRSYTYKYGEPPSNLNVEFDEEDGGTFSKLSDEGDYLWFSFVRPGKVQELALKLGCSEKELRNIVAVHELVHKNCSDIDTDLRAEEAWARLAQMLYRRRTVLQASLIGAATAASKQQFPENHDFIIQAMRKAIAGSFTENNTEVVDQFLATIESERAKAKAANDVQKDPQKKITVAQVIDGVITSTATKISSRGYGSVTKIYNDIYETLEQNFIAELADYLPE